MNESEDYILESIKTWVWSGFYNSDEINEMIEDIMEEGADEGILRASIAPEFEKKSIAESSWPQETDCDRLNTAFDAIFAKGIVALQNIGYTREDALIDVFDVLEECGEFELKGYCFYHGEDLEQVVQGGDLLISFGDLEGNQTTEIEVANEVKQVLDDNRFTVEWDGEAKSPLRIVSIDWKRRLPE